MKYQHYNHQRRALLTGVASILIGFLVSFDGFSRSSLVFCSDGEYYEIVTDLPKWVAITAFLRAFVGVVGILAILGLAIAFTIKYRRNMKKHEELEQLGSSGLVSSNTLSKILAVQVISLLIAGTPAVAWTAYVVVSAASSIPQHGNLSLIMLYLVDVTVPLTGALNFIFYFWISKSFRKTALDSLCCRKYTTTAVIPLTSISKN